MINSLDAWESFVIIGDYGTGKTVLLDSATQKLVSQNVPVYFHCALDYEEGVKMSDDVLDVMLRYHNLINLHNGIINAMFLKMFRKKFRQTADITFLSVADLRKTFEKTKRMYSFSSTYLSKKIK